MLKLNHLRDRARRGGFVSIRSHGKPGTTKNDAPSFACARPPAAQHAATARARTRAAERPTRRDDAEGGRRAPTQSGPTPRLRCRPADTNANPARPLLARWCRIGSLPSHPALSQLSPPLSPASTNSLTSRVYMCVCVCVCVCEASGRGRHSLRRSRPPLVAAAAVPPGAVAHSLSTLRATGVACILMSRVPRARGTHALQRSPRARARASASAVGRRRPISSLRRRASWLVRRSSAALVREKLREQREAVRGRDARERAHLALERLGRRVERELARARRAAGRERARRDALALDAARVLQLVARRAALDDGGTRRAGRGGVMTVTSSSL